MVVERAGRERVHAGVEGGTAEQELKRISERFQQEATTAAGQVTIRTAGGGEVVSFSQKNVVDHMIRGDSVESIRTLSDLRAMPADSGFDRAFSREQIRHHVEDVNSLRTPARTTSPRQR